MRGGCGRIENVLALKAVVVLVTELFRVDPLKFPTRDSKVAGCFVCTGEVREPALNEGELARVAAFALRLLLFNEN